VNQTWPGVVITARLGADVHPRGWPAYLTIGPFVDLEATAVAQESPNNNDGSNQGKNASYVTFAGGLRSTVEF
jgi:hypothetical protein